MAAGPTLFLIDGSNQMYRAYHAIRGLTRSDGKSTNATYGFITMLRKLLADHQPQYILASFDLKGPTFRSEVAADYKANSTPIGEASARRATDHVPVRGGAVAMPWSAAASCCAMSAR